MKQLWAPWRMTYIDQVVKDPGCIFCDKYRQDDLRSALVLKETEHSVVMMNKYPYNNGHLLIAPKRHQKDPAGLSTAEFIDLNETLRGALEIVRQVYQPGGVNLGMNLGKCAGAGIEDHLHWHVVPRWEGDTNFMPVVAETRVMPQHLFDSYDRLQPLFAKP
ncbi:MAG TPA: HIT domain-containing protein [Terriglobales bacterium]|nr:HIT domain-containing protein [Terriglobales bacterium]